MQGNQQSLHQTTAHVARRWSLYRTSGGVEIRMRRAHPADARAIQSFVHSLSAATRRKRFFGPINELSPAYLERVTSRESPDDLNLIALDRCGQIIGMAQCAANDHSEAEFAVVIGDDWQRKGLGAAMLDRLIEHARGRDLTSLNGLVLRDNWPMLALAAKFGFSVEESGDPSVVRVEMPLTDAGASMPTDRRAMALA